MIHSGSPGRERLAPVVRIQNRRPAAARLATAARMSFVASSEQPATERRAVRCRQAGVAVAAMALLAATSSLMIPRDDTPAAPEANTPLGYLVREPHTADVFTVDQAGRVYYEDLGGDKGGYRCDFSDPAADKRYLAQPGDGTDTLALGVEGEDFTLTRGSKCLKAAQVLVQNIVGRGGVQPGVKYPYPATVTATFIPEN